MTGWSKRLGVRGRHKHLASDIIDETTREPEDLGGGAGGVTVTDGTTTVDPVTSISTAIVVDAGGGVATVGTAVVSATDPGAIGPGNFWVRTDVTNDWPTSLRVRNAADTGWEDWLGLAAYDGGGNTTQAISVSPGGGIVVAIVDPVTHLATLSLEMNAGTFDLLFAGGAEMTLDAAGIILYPPAGPALQVNDSGLIYNNQPVGTRAAFVANGSTVDQLRDALIASGLMAAS